MIAIKKLLSVSLFGVFMVSTIHAQRVDSILYKQVDSVSLYMHIDYPPLYQESETYPAIVFFFGGGWIGGSVEHFVHHARYFSQRGMICFRVDYRVKSRQGTTPFESLKDARSAMRFIRGHAGDYGVDPERIVGSGGSAGGHLAAGTALSYGYDEEGEELSISAIPNAMVLFNPVIDNGPGGYGYERIGEAYRSFSPIYNIHEGAPPTALFLGTADPLIPVETACYYKTVMEKVGSRCDLFLYEGAGHGFFNYNQIDNYRKTVEEANQFLISLGFLKEAPLVEIK